MKFKKLAATLATSFVLVACSDDKAKDAEQAVQNAMGNAEQVMAEQKAFKAKIAKPNPPTVTVAKSPSNVASYEDRADQLAERVKSSDNPRADKQLGADIRTLLADTVMDKSVTAQQFNALTEKLDGPKATAASGIMFNKNMARNKDACNKTLSTVATNPSLVAPLLVGCMNKR